MYYPSLEEAKKLSEQFNFIPVCCEIFSDFRTPIAVLKNISIISKQYYLLESVEGEEKWGRYSFLGYNPLLQVKCIDGITTIIRGSTSERYEKNPNLVLRELINEYRSPKLAPLPPFAGGFVGYFSYDYIKYSEPCLKLNGDNSPHFVDVDLMLFDKVIAFDHMKQKILVIMNIKADDIDINYTKAIRELSETVKLIKANIPSSYVKSGLKTSFKSQFDKQQFCSMVNKVKHHIFEGDIFQAVISNRLTAEFEGSLFDTYRVLRTTNPSPYMFYLKTDDLELAGASPETLIKLQDGTLSAFPIAGSRPRGTNSIEDESLIQSLLSDEKELAEHNMLVDLARNDLGRISEFGSVKVSEYLSTCKYSHVIHIESKVTSKLKNGCDQLDVISAMLPAGTLSGAPKIKACQIINSLEGSKRGIYGGAVGYIDLTGNIDVCIGIRMAVLKDGVVYVQSGCGVVADSVPETEYQEAQNKARAMVNALTYGKEIE